MKYREYVLAGWAATAALAQPSADQVLVRFPGDFFAGGFLNERREGMKEPPMHADARRSDSARMEPQMDTDGHG